MAYKRQFNPDALPAHAEPEQAAQALAQFSLNPQTVNTSKPAPPLPPSQQQFKPSVPDPHRPPYYNSSNSPSYQTDYSQHPQPQKNQNPYSSSPSIPSGHSWNSRQSPPQQPTHQQWNSTQHYPPRTPAPPEPDSADLYPLFRAANVSRTGSLTSSELGNALVNADYTPFDPRTIKSLMKMFSHSPLGQPGGPTMTFQEFQSLWRFLAEWRELFERFDDDSSGRISMDEFSRALDAFGYRLTNTFVSVLYHAYNGNSPERRGSRGQPHGQGMTFDLFVQACISLKHMTDVFKGYDDDRDGYVTLSFEEFLTEMLRMLN